MRHATLAKIAPFHLKATMSHALHDLVPHKHTLHTKVLFRFKPASSNDRVSKDTFTSDRHRYRALQIILHALKARFVMTGCKKVAEGYLAVMDTNTNKYTVRDLNV